MPRKTSPPRVRTREKESRTHTPSMPASEALSFLKETHGSITWSTGDLAKALKIPAAAAREILPILEMQGYVKPEGTHWITTAQGEAVSGSKMPRFSRKTVEGAVKHLAEWIKVVNGDAKAAYRITEAVAFGDFLNRSATRAQGADVGIRLQARKNLDDPESAREYKTEEAFLKHLRGRSPMLNLQVYEPWMSARTHMKLL